MTYVHELQTPVRNLTTPETLEIVLNCTDWFFACSNAVRRYLIEELGVSPGHIDTVYASIPVVARKKVMFEKYIRAFREAREVTGKTIVAGVVGSWEWRKGADLFFPLALLFFRLYPESDLLFVWKGISPGSRQALEAAYDMKKAGLDDRVLLLPHDNDNIELMACLDIHVLLSREDLYPITVLEAASFGIPTICFEGSGGIPEFVGNDAGFCVQYGNLTEMAERIHELSQNAGLANQLGQRAREKVSTHTHAAAVEKIYHRMKDLHMKRSALPVDQRSAEIPASHEVALSD